MTEIRKTFQYGEKTVTLETGVVARQAHGAVVLTMGDTKILATVVAEKKSVVKRDFLPFTVDYIEKTYAAGRISGGFLKREGRPSEKEILTSRLIDRPLRPLFPEGFHNEVQLIVTVLSFDPDLDTEIPALLASSAALAISGIPMNDIMAAARVGYHDGVFTLNPTPKHLQDSKLDLVVAGTEKAVFMVESEAQELPEATMLSGVMFGHESLRIATKAIKEFAAEVNKAPMAWQPAADDAAFIAKVKALAEQEIIAAYQIQEKTARYARLDAIKAKAIEQLVTAEENSPTEHEVLTQIENIKSEVVRQRILRGEPRIDGRNTTSVRPITIQLGYLPRAHGSALFTRGETQAIVVTTLGTARDAQLIESLTGESKDRFMLHYNFPPYSVGELGRVGSPKRREIGHGRLAKRALITQLPKEDDFPYVVRLVSEITESNGSSSMATVCGGSLALMDAGVPVPSPVAGIAMGLIKEGEKFAVLTDILGDEDHLGDMDFKVAGTEKGVTALQMDIKTDGITREIMQQALEQALEGRIHILKIMNQAITGSRSDVSEFAPRIITMRIPRDKIRDVIGKGGVTIRGIIEETGANIDITDDGVVKIAAVDGAAGEAARREIERLTADVEVGRIYEGTVARLMDFGAFVTILPGRDGLVHISQISKERVSDVSTVLKEGQVVSVKVLEVDKQGKIRLSMKEVVEE